MSRSSRSHARAKTAWSASVQCVCAIIASGMAVRSIGRSNRTRRSTSPSSSISRTIGECFQRAKQEFGLAPLRGTFLARLAPLHDAVYASHCPPGAPGGRAPPRRRQQTEQNKSGRPRLIPTPMGSPGVPGIRIPIAKLLLRPPLRTNFILAWSVWRQRHQLTAAEAHYRFQQTQL